MRCVRLRLEISESGGIIPNSGDRSHYLKPNIMALRGDSTSIYLSFLKVDTVLADCSLITHCRTTIEKEGMFIVREKDFYPI